MTFVQCLIFRHQSTSSSLLPPFLLRPPSITRPLPSLLMRKVVGWKCYALSADSARNSAGIVWEGRQTWCSPTWLWHGTTEERDGAEGRGVKKIQPVPVTRDQGSQLSRNHGNVSHWWGIFHCHQCGQSGGSRWNGWYSRNATLKGGGLEGKRSDRMLREKQTKLGDFPFI